MSVRIVNKGLYPRIGDAAFVNERFSLSSWELFGARDEPNSKSNPVTFARLEGPSNEQVRLPRSSVVDDFFELEIPSPRLPIHGLLQTVLRSQNALAELSDGFRPQEQFVDGHGERVGVVDDGGGEARGFHRAPPR
jgi:hypothetical protein